MDNSNRIVCIIPARHDSTRFPGKPLAKLAGKYVIERTWEQAKKSQLVQRVIVATDDARIQAVVEGFGGDVVMTSKRAQNGTERISEALNLLALDCSIVVNVQGDEPLVSPDHIDAVVVALLEDAGAVMANACSPLSARAEAEQSNVVKVVVDSERHALYYSRALIPSNKRGAWNIGAAYKKALGLYAYRRPFLRAYVALQSTRAQVEEDLEMLRAMEHGYKICVVDVTSSHRGVDTPEDLVYLESILSAASSSGSSSNAGGVADAQADLSAHSESSAQHQQQRQQQHVALSSLVSLPVALTTTGRRSGASMDVYYLADAHLGTIEAQTVFCTSKEEFRARSMAQKLVDSFDFSTVLDVGSGDGAAASFFAAHGKRVTTNDIGRSPNFDATAARGRVRHIAGDFLRVAFDADERFDVVWASHVLEHQRNVGLFLERCFELLSEDGLLAIAVPPRKANIVGGHVTLWNIGLLLYNLVLAGFDCSGPDIYCRKYAYNNCVIVRKRCAQLPELGMDKGDIELLASFFPFDATQGFDGDIIAINWDTL